MTENTPEQAAGSTAGTEPGAGPEADAAADAAQNPAPAKKAARKRAPRKKAATAQVPASDAPADDAAAEGDRAADASTDAAASLGEQAAADETPAPAKKAARKRAPRKRAAAAEASASVAEPLPEIADQTDVAVVADEDQDEALTVAAAEAPEDGASPTSTAPAAGFGGLLFQAPDPAAAPPRRRRRASAPAGPPVPHDDADQDADAAAAASDSAPAAAADQTADQTADETADETTDEPGSGDDTGEGGGRKRRRRGGRGRRGKGEEQDAGSDDAEGSQDAAGDAAGDADRAAGDQDGSDGSSQSADTPDDSAGSDDDEGSSSSRRRRRRRRRAGSGEDAASDDPPGTVTRVRQPRRADDEVASVKGSTRLEAKKQRRRDGREAGRRKPVITESEFLARRESVERTMLVREREGRTQIAVLEDDVLVEHYVANETNASMIGNVYLGRVQNVLPSMEAAFIDIGKGRNAVLYAGEVNWDAAGLEGQPRRIEAALKSGDQVLVQVTKDPMGHKGARLTSQISLPGRYLVYVPNGSMTGISRKLPDTERSRLKKILKAVVPEHAGVIVRTAAEGASETELQRDVERLTAQWADIEKKAGSSSGGSAPKLLHGEPDLTVRVIRDVFNEDFAKLVVSGRAAWDEVQPYVASVASDLADRVSRWTSQDDVFAAHRVDEQLAKAMDRKVWLPSGGSLVIDRTEAMTVVDVNTGKFTGAGGNLEETVTRNNLEAAEEIVRQLRLRDIGGIIVVDFIDMVLEGNRDLVLRRLLECLGRDRTKHQVAEVTSLGLVQMTRKRVGQGLLEVFSEPCEHCHGRGVIVHAEPVQSKGGNGGGNGGGGNGGGGNGGGGNGGGGNGGGGNGGGGNGGGGSKGEKSEGGGRTRGGRGRRGGSVGGGEHEPAPAPERKPIPAEFVASLAHHEEHGHDEQPADDRDGAQPSDAAVAITGNSTTAAELATEPSGAPVDDALPGQSPAVDVPAEQPAEQPAAEPAPEPAAEPAPEPAGAEVPPVEAPPARAPRRRRRASAPAGPPAPTS